MHLLLAIMVVPERPGFVPAAAAVAVAIALHGLYLFESCAPALSSDRQQIVLAPCEELESCAASRLEC